MKKVFVVLLAVSFFMPAAQAQEKIGAVIRIGIIGLDTSHVPAFTAEFNKLPGFKVVAGFPGGSPDVKASYSRVEGFTKTLKEKYGVEIVDSVDALVQKVDVVLLESVDGRPHLMQALPALKAGKKIFIDKPIAGSLADALMIFELANRYKTPVFSSSSLRFIPSVRGVKNDPKLGKIVGCISYGPCEIESYVPDLFWYGIHGVESLYELMGTGCKSVARSHTKDTDVATGVWADGRIGEYRGLRSGKKGFGNVVFAEKATISTDPDKSGYKPLVAEIAKFFRTGEPPVRAQETIEIFAFMEAADQSKRQGGAPVMLDSVLEKAREFNRTRKLP